MKYPFFEKSTKNPIGSSSGHSVFWNITLDKGKVKSFVSWFLENHGEKKTLQLLEELKNLGFGYSTRAGVSLGIEDLKIPPNKVRLLAEAENAVSNSIDLYRKGEITGIEKVQRFIETWHETSENLKQEVVRYFEKTDLFNPVYMMAFSGARGNLSQVRQLVGMRGLMADPQGKIIDFPILSNFREGLTLTEYLISTYGARKGIVDTALRTATAGYLTRRLVDVAQHILVSKFDCGTQRGIFLFDMKEGNKIIYSFENRLTGRVLAQDIFANPGTKKDTRFGTSLVPSLIAGRSAHLEAHRNQEIDPLLAFHLSKIVKKALVRSPLTCETRKSVCQLCYGWSLATTKLVSIGEAVGVIAGQSIGEPGTQLTMRTFHTGGVFSGGITEQINAPFSGRVEYSTPIAGSCVRTPQGFLSFLTKTPGTVFLKKESSPSSFDLGNVGEKKEVNPPDSIKIYKIPPFTILFARHGEFVKKGQVLIQISSLPIGQRTTQTIEQTIYSSLQGEIYFSQLDLLEDIDDKYGERLSKSENWGKVWVLGAQISQNNLISQSLPIKGDIVLKNSVVNQIQWIKDLTQLMYLKNSFSNSQKLSNFDFSSISQNALKNQIRVENAIKNEKAPIVIEENSINLDPKAIMFGSFSSKLFSRLKEPNDKDGRPSLSKQCYNFKKTEMNSGFSSMDRFKQTQTSLRYPFTLNFHLMRLTTKTSFSIPFFQPGALSRWISGRKDNSKKVKKTEIFNRLKTNSAFLVRPISMNKKFHSKNLNKPNFLHPLLLTNFLPCFFKNAKLQITKVFKHRFFEQNRVFSYSGIYPFLLYPYLKNPLKRFIGYNISVPERAEGKNWNTDKANTWFSKKFQETLLIKIQTSSKSFQKNVLGKERSVFYSRFSSKNSITQDRFSNKSLKTKFDHFILKNRLLAFNIKKVKHQKLGYFITIENILGQKDTFFSFLPIMNGASIPSSQRYKTLQSSIEKVEKTKVSMFDTFTLKNTDFWSRQNGEGFCWFPAFSKIDTSCLISISTPFYQPKSFLKNSIEQQKKPTKKINSKLTVFEFNNLAQSQTHKNLELKRAVFQIENFVFEQKGRNRLSFLCVNTIFKSIKNFSIKPSEHYPLLKSVSRDFLQKKKPLILRDKKSVKSFFLNLRSYRYSQNSCLPTKTLIFSKKSLPFVLTSTKNSINGLSSKHSPYTSSFLRKSYLIENNVFGQKGVRQQQAKEKKAKPIFAERVPTVSNLKTLINTLHKSSVNFHEIFCLPQENYLLRTNLFKNSALKISIETASQQKNPFTFYALLNKNPLCVFKNRVPIFHLVNSQGLKKSLVFKGEGLFKLQSITNSSQNSTPSMVSVASPISDEMKKKQRIFNRLLKKTSVAPKHQSVFNFTAINDLEYGAFHQSQNFKPKEKKSSSFRGFENIKDSRALLLKLKFVDYLRNKNKKTQTACIKNKDVFTAYPDNNLQISVISKTSKPFLGFVPLFREKTIKNKKEINTKLSQALKMPSLQSHEFILNIKPGWVYKTTNNLNSLKSSRFIEFGNTILDDLSFAHRHVLIETVPSFPMLNSNKIVYHIFHKEYSERSCYFNISRTVLNYQSRFPQVRPPKKNIDDKNASLDQNMYFLIQPFINKYLPNITKLKMQLYKSMTKKRSDLCKTSYGFYKEYFSNHSNLQQSNLKILSEFLPNEIHLRLLNSFFSLESTILKLGKTKSNDKKAAPTSFLTKRKYRIQSSNWLFPPFSTNTRNLFENSQFLKEATPFFLTKTKNKLGRFVKKAGMKKAQSSGFNEFVYFSYCSFNWATVKISLDLMNAGLFNISSTEISFNTINTNIFFSETKPNTAFSTLRYQYLQLLMYRSFFKKEKNPETLSPLFLNKQKMEPFDFSKERKPVQCQPRFSSTVCSIATRTDKKMGTPKISSLLSFLDFVQPMPFFEYSLNKRYAFFGNQKLFSTSFYESQVLDFFRISLFKDKMFRDENLKEERFINRVSDKNRLSESYRTRSISKNQILFKNVFKDKICLGMTSFYSPFEGEVLQSYSHEKKSPIWKKNINSYLNKTLLEEKRARTAILTKSNIFSLHFFAPPTARQPVASRPGEQNRHQDAVNNTIVNPKVRLTKVENVKTFFTMILNRTRLNLLKNSHQAFQNLENNYFKSLNFEKYDISRFETIYKKKRYKIHSINFGLTRSNRKFRLGELIYPGDPFYSQRTFLKAGLIIHLNREKLTLRKAEFFSISPQAILHAYNGDFILENQAVMTLPFQTLKTGDIVQGIPKVEQYLEARTTIQGRLFLNSLPVLLDAIYQRYASRLNIEKSVRQSFLKIQQILVDGVQRVYRSQGVSIADKHLEIIVRQMTSKVKITYGGQTGFFPGELIDLEFVERMNRFFMVKIRYEPVVLGITRASLEVDSFLSAASFQQTTKVLTRSALENKRDFLKGLKENLLVGNLLPAGTGYILPISPEKLII